MQRIKRLFLKIILLAVLAGAAFVYFQTPSHDRAWADNYARTPGATVSSSTITLHNVRDWNHTSTSTIDRTWHDLVDISIADVESVWFGVASMQTEGITGHSFLSFELASGTVYTFSIEARREVGEEYNIFAGAVNTFELWYGWGTERDFLGASMFLLDRPLEYYRLELTPQEAQAVFVAVASETAAVAAQPRFYNTLTANCTNLFAKIINDRYPDSLPYHPGWNLPGLAPRYLHKQELIDPSIPFKQHEATASVDITDPALLSTIDQTPADFSRVLRDSLQK